MARDYIMPPRRVDHCPGNISDSYNSALDDHPFYSSFPVVSLNRAVCSNTDNENFVLTIGLDLERFFTSQNAERLPPRGTALKDGKSHTEYEDYRRTTYTT